MSTSRRFTAGRRRTARTAALLVTTSLAVLAACGGSSTPTATGPGPSTPSTSTTAPATPTSSVATTLVGNPPTIVVPRTTPPVPATTAAPQRLTDASRLRLDGIGPVDVGMTLAEASAAAHTPIRITGADIGTDCRYAKAEDGPPGLLFMVEGGRIVRVDVGTPASPSPSPVNTVSGAHIGSSESEVKALYPGRIEVTRAPYDEKGHYLTYKPTDAASRRYGLIFETDGQKVTRFRSGLVDAVGQIEGCA
jgi:hypothetical protein